MDKIPTATAININSIPTATAIPIAIIVEENISRQYSFNQEMAEVERMAHDANFLPPATPDRSKGEQGYLKVPF
jgi:hypothetical protein